MEIPPHLLHETQCVEACRTSSSETEGFAVFDKQDKRCTCVAKSLRWNALVDNTESDCSSLRYKVASVSHSDITFPFTQVYDISLVPNRRTATSSFSRSKSSGGNQPMTLLKAERCSATGQSQTTRTQRGVGYSRLRRWRECPLYPQTD